MLQRLVQGLCKVCGSRKAGKTGEDCLPCTVWQSSTAAERQAARLVVAKQRAAERESPQRVAERESKARERVLRRVVQQVSESLAADEARDATRVARCVEQQGCKLDVMTGRLVVRVVCHNARRQRRIERRREVLLAYGGKCVCCGECRHEAFLQLDHVHNDGAEHRRELRATNVSSIYHWAKAMGYPPRLQLLCGSCHAAKGRLGECPCQRQRREQVFEPLPWIA